MKYVFVDNFNKVIIIYFIQCILFYNINISSINNMINGENKLLYISIKNKKIQY